MLRLVVPTLAMKEKALRFKQAHLDCGETVINGSGRLDKTTRYEVWLEMVTKNADPETVPVECVQTDTFFAIDETGEIVGVIDLRHTLRGLLKDFGHCGYSVHPAHRGKGYATEMLRQIIGIAKAAGLNELQLSARRDNAASVHIIQKHGGVYVRSFLCESEWADIYVIPLTEQPDFICPAGSGAPPPQAHVSPETV